MNEEQIRQIIRDELSNIIKIDRFVFDKHIQILDARNIQCGVTNGLKIGTSALQKIGFWGEAPRVQEPLINKPSSPSATYVQAEALAVRNAVNYVIASLESIGILAD